MPRQEKVEVAVLGAGLSGLSAGLEFERVGVDYRVFEKSTRVGGHVITTAEAGYRFDRTGHLLHLRSEALRNEVLAWLGADCVSVERRSVIFSHGGYTRYPFQANTLGLPPEVAHECLVGFVRALMQRGQSAPANFEDFCRVHFGEGFSKHFMLPYNEKLWGVPAREVSAAWCQRFVPLPKLEDVIAGAVGLPDPGLGYNARFLFPKRGIGALSDAFAARVSNVSLARAPRSIDAERRELVFDDAKLCYEVLLSTAPLPSLLALFERLPESVSRAREQLRATSLYYLDIALTKPCGKDFHWAYVPEAKYPFYRVGCYSNFWHEMAPPGRANLYVELAERRVPNQLALIDQVAAGLVEMGVIESQGDIAFARLRELDPAYVIYDANYEAALASIRPFLEEMRVISTGRYGGWNYSSMEDAIMFGREAAAHAQRWLA